MFDKLKKKPKRWWWSGDLVLCYGEGGIFQGNDDKQRAIKRTQGATVDEYENCVNHIFWFSQWPDKTNFEPPSSEQFHH